MHASFFFRFSSVKLAQVCFENMYNAYQGFNNIDKQLKPISLQFYLLARKYREPQTNLENSIFDTF